MSPQKDQAQREWENKMREQQEAREALESYKSYKPDRDFHASFGVISGTTR
jgi:U4/U6.U5 tri-snRNP-associated protein 1